MSFERILVNVLRGKGFIRQGKERFWLIYDQGIDMRMVELGGGESLG